MKMRLSHIYSGNCVRVMDKKIDKEHIDLMMLDHDLGGKTYVDQNEKNTGSEVVRYILKNREDEKFKGTRIIVHTFNTPAGKSMTDVLRQHGFDVLFVPGIWIKNTFRQHIKMDYV